MVGISKPKTALFSTFRRDEKGSFTIEASLIFPIIFLLIVTLLLFTMYVFQKGFLFYKATMIAERAAFSWNNSQRDPVTGDLASIKKSNGTWNADFIWWRLFSDGVTGGAIDYPLQANQTLENALLLEKTRQAAGSSLVTATGKTTPVAKRDVALPKYKMARAAASMAAGEQGSTTYQNLWITRTVKVGLITPANVPRFTQIFWKPSGTYEQPRASGQAANMVTDPVEFLRNIEFYTEYLPAKFE